MNKTGTVVIKTYYFNLIRSVGLESVAASDVDGQKLTVTPQEGNTYTVAVPGEKFNLTCKAKTPNYAKIKIDGEEVESESPHELDLTKYPENEKGQKLIPISLE